MQMFFSFFSKINLVYNFYLHKIYAQMCKNHYLCNYKPVKANCKDSTTLPTEPTHSTTMPTIDTRATIIDVARRLFAQQGIESTTIGDVAAASGKSRRTIYTYFKSKEELLEASIESEMKKISSAMQKVAAENITPDKKIIKLIFVRLRITRSIVRRNSGLHSEYFGNMWIVEHIRRTFDVHEIALYRSIIAEGQQQGIFNVENPNLTARFLHFCLNGLEVPFIKGVINKHKDEEFLKNFSEKIILSALGAITPAKKA